jgi:soluble lytic murein transglycosylase-like protein
MDSPMSRKLRLAAACCLGFSAVAILSGVAPADELDQARPPTFATPANASAASNGPNSNLRVTAPSSEDFLARLKIGEGRWLAAVQKAARANDIPEDFLRRLLTQESSFNPSSISRAGALGIAQFMPGTAVSMKLRDPFDAEEAIQASGRLVAVLRNRMGNLGLAAAAYNAGETRVRAWLAGRQSLPRETIDYVRRITGTSVEAWAGRPLAPAASIGSVVALRVPEKPRTRSARKPREGREAALCRAVGGATHACLVLRSY